MWSILLGFLLSLLVGILVWLIGMVVSDSCYNDDLVRVIFIILAILVVVCGTVAGGYIEYTTSCKYVSEYEVIKTTIENSLSTDSLTGFERAELVNAATEYNAELSGYQFKCNQWYGFTISKDVLNLEYIDLSVGGSNG